MAQILYFIEGTGYNRYLVNAGAEDTDIRFFDYIKNPVLNQLFKWHNAWPLNCRRDAPLVSIWFPRALRGMQIRPDSIGYIIMAESFHLSFCLGFLRKLKKMCPGMKRLFCFSNPADSYNLTKLGKVRAEYDAVVTFVEKDAEDNGFLYYDKPLLRLPDPALDDEPESDVFFIGADKGRLDILLRIHDALSSKGVRCLFIVPGVEPSRQQPRPGILYGGRITYEKALGYVKRCRCVLEVLQSGENYNSIRLAEAITFRKKILTTNSKVTESSIYDPAFVKVVRDPASIDAEWLFRPVPDAVYDARIDLIDNFHAFKSFLAAHVTDG